MVETILLIVFASIGLGIIHTLRNHTIIVINRKDPTMATIKERLTALEAAVARQGDAASADTVTALAERVTAVEVEIGTDPVADPTPVDGALALDQPIDASIAPATEG